MGSIASTVRGDDEVQVVARTRSPSHDDGVERTWFERFDFLYPDILFEIEGAADLLEERPFSLENLQLDDSDFEIDVTRNMFDNEAERGERLERERVDIMEVIEAFEAAEIIAGLSTRRASLSACDREILCALGDGASCAECGRDFSTEGLVWKVHYSNCGSCSVSICPACYLAVPMRNGKMCGCCGEWHCDHCFYDHEVETGYIDE